MKPDPNCCLCGLPYEQIGNNPAPLAEKGRCCNACDQVVVAARIDPATVMAEIERVEQALDRKSGRSTRGDLRAMALAAICASRGPGLWAARQNEQELVREFWPHLIRH